MRVWEEFPCGPEGMFLKRGSGRRSSSYAKAYIYPLLAAPFIWLFGTNGFLVLHALLMTLCFACAYAFLAARSHPVAALIFAFAFLFVSVVPIYMVQLGAGLLHLRDRPVRLLLLVLQGSRRTAAPSRRERRGARAGCWRRAPTSSRPLLLGVGDVCQADQHRLDRAAAGVGGAAQAVVRARSRSRRVFGGVVVGAVRAEHRA